MGGECSVPNCRSGYLVENEKRKLSVCSFSKHEEIGRKWIRAIPRDNWEPLMNFGDCQHHYKPDDFVFDRPDTNEKHKKNKAPFGITK